LTTWVLPGTVRRVTRGEERVVRELIHEIRTPLAALALLGEGLDEAARFAHRETVALIESLLHAAVGQHRLGQLAPVEAVVRSALRMVAAVKPAAVLSVEGSSSKAVPREVVEQILLNLLMNAVRHSPADAAVRVRIVDAGDAVRIEVVDQGCGVLPSERERIFDDGYSTAASSGLGLGISRRLATDLGGTLVLEDAVQGCRMVLTLPTAG
jgi:signal transduction histidine kinase